MVVNSSNEEENIVEQFRQQMKDVVPPSMYEEKHIFHKFLKARNFNIVQAEAMLRRHLRWRREIQIETIITDFQAPEVLQKYMSQSFLGFSKEGYLLLYTALGNSDGKGMFKSVNKVDALKTCLQEIEKDLVRLKHHSEKIGRTVNQCIFIYDMDKMTLAKATHRSSAEIFAYGVSTFQDNYPEILKNLYIINASVYFTIVFPIFKAIMSGALMEKIKVYGTDGWKEELLKHIDADVLPAFLGGTRTDPDGNPNCNTFVAKAGFIPESYYITKDVGRIASKPGTKRYNIDRHSGTTERVHVKQAGSIINWEIEIKSHDIGFGLLFEGRDMESGASEELIPVHKFETELESVTGLFRCKEPGTYIFVLDNTYSWLYSKEVYLRTWVSGPESLQAQEKNNTSFAIDY